MKSDGIMSAMVVAGILATGAVAYKADELQKVATRTVVVTQVVEDDAVVEHRRTAYVAGFYWTTSNRTTKVNQNFGPAQPVTEHRRGAEVRHGIFRRRE